ncbi:MAG: hypothetical protein QNJ53_01260 [Pleurocapsa sp. MO_192.B19]|nr:hypothetical protein [Pleurocapsa sp. MO_192.B19]
MYLINWFGAKFWNLLTVDDIIPTKLLTGESHSHWLELLGFDLFRRPAIVA